jgi:hypothetical protein
MLWKPLRLFSSIIILNILATFLLLVLVEGFAGVVAFIRLFRSEGVVAENRHTIYDPAVGWVNKSDITIPDMYGKGNALTVRSDRSRMTSFPKSPSGKRMICSGDSFTLGYGVSDDEAWCSLLSESGFETANLGQGGYGVDQSYVWYEQYAKTHPHDLHLAAFTLYDFSRVFSPSFLGVGKPYFRMERGELKNRNIPMPPPQPLGRFLAVHRESFQSLHLYTLITHFTRPNDTNPVPENEQEEIIATLISKMRQATVENHATFILLLLPTPPDYLDRDPYEKRKEQLMALAERGQFLFLDVGETLFLSDQTAYDALFIPKGVMPYNGSGGHYTEEGNRKVAAIVAEFLKKSGLLNEPRD